MKDRWDIRLDGLFAEARKRPPDTSFAEEHFETRLMAKIRDLRARVPWYGLAWRLVPVFSLITAFLLFYAMAFNPERSTDIFAAISAPNEEYVALNSFGGE